MDFRVNVYENETRIKMVTNGGQKKKKKREFINLVTLNASKKILYHGHTLYYRLNYRHFRIISCSSNHFCMGIVISKFKISTTKLNVYVIMECNKVLNSAKGTE